MTDYGDATEIIRRVLMDQEWADHATREELEHRYGQVWDTAQLGADFDVDAFMAPFVVVLRREDGAVGSLQFQHFPRFYFNFVKDRK